MEAKSLTAETYKYLQTLRWPGNVRQLENVCRWLTVMAPGRDIHINDLPPELLNKTEDSSSSLVSPGQGWEELLGNWAAEALNRGEKHILREAIPSFERILIQTALDNTRGRKRDAAQLLGWGRNTLTRKLQDLKLANYSED